MAQRGVHFALLPVDVEKLRQVDVAAADGTPLPHDDFEYLWTCFRGLPEFFGKAAADGRAMVFTVDL